MIMIGCGTLVTIGDGHLFHYGRWFYDPYYGWLWVPGYDWSPAWVTWRGGGDYYGWAPIRPGISISIGLAVTILLMITGHLHPAVI